jgi:D-beta-D-heptose 7-phosphate kinase/D-beta-D-heptose 1-phosphate adenosyltransferase
MKVLVIGDIIIDKYVYGTSTRLSPEAPVPVITQERIVETVGGAGLVYENLKSLGVDVELYDSGWKKSVKTRVICDGHYVTRIDDDFVIPGEEFLDQILLIDFSAYDYVILSDYNKGTLDESLKIIEHINQFDCKIIVDPKRHASCYKGAWLVKPNGLEFEGLGFTKWLGNIITTNAANPVIAEIDKQYYTIPVDPIEVNDVTGAGDCFLAAFVYALTKGYNYQKSLELAVCGSTESVKHVGTYILKEKDLKKRVVFTNGCFDILHKGHLTLLKEARSLGDKLVVGLNSDDSVKRLKGSSRPVNSLETRREQLELIPYIDEVIVFEEDTPYKLIKNLKPDLIVKGGDYTVEEIVGHDLAPVHIVPTVKGHSTTKLIGEINGS